MASLVPSTVELKNNKHAVLRHAMPDDAHAVIDCARDVFATSPYVLTQADEFTMTVEQERAFLGEKLAAPHELFLVGLESPEPHTIAGGGSPRIIGILDLKPLTKRRKHRHTALLGISIRSTHRGLGLGEAMLRAAIAWAEQDPILEVMTLEVYAANTTGLNLYRKLGFTEYGRLPAGCKHDDGTTWEQVMMARKLR
jgi:ribosomal protein S18 acetylase RimI-like enzyme